jgi:[ribosomal protein S18]-alanine N-acetyltransferase
MIRPYKSTNKEELVKILQLNVPKYFDTAEEKDFVEYLDGRGENLFRF